MTMTLNAYQRVADGVRQGIADGTYAAGDQLPIQKEMADQYSVGQATVSRALRLLEKEGLAYTCPRGAFVGPRPKNVPWA